MVQIYQNPKAINADNIANQHNPEFAAFNSAMSGFHDAAIGDALNKLALNDKQNDLIGGLKRAQLQRAWGKADQNDNFLRNLNLHLAQNGYEGDAKSIQDALYRIGRMNEENQPVGPYEFGVTTNGQGASVPSFSTQTGAALPNFAQFMGKNGINSMDNLPLDVQSKVNELMREGKRLRVKDPTAGDALIKQANDLVKESNMNRIKDINKITGQDNQPKLSDREKPFFDSDAFGYLSANSWNDLASGYSSNPNFNFIKRKQENTSDNPLIKLSNFISSVANMGYNDEDGFHLGIPEENAFTKFVRNAQNVNNNRNYVKAIESYQKLLQDKGLVSVKNNASTLQDLQLRGLNDILQANGMVLDNVDVAMNQNGYIYVIDPAKNNSIVLQNTGMGLQQIK